MAKGERCRFCGKLWEDHEDLGPSGMGCSTTFEPVVMKAQLRFRNDHERRTWGDTIAHALGGRTTRIGGGLGDRPLRLEECEELADEAVFAMRVREGLPRG